VELLCIVCILVLEQNVTSYRVVIITGCLQRFLHRFNTYCRVQ